MDRKLRQGIDRTVDLEQMYTATVIYTDKRRVNYDNY
ncbi:hypothetical protein PP241_gp42 [Streptococcus phage P7601]|uniref:Uncharacterized protein n=1 Tax=Streptococcus phage P7601 TaxID=1971431 RepID=A0A286QPX2_9CAUD|nr:hypothetical protein PP241_gp42 [Streptococcus phage P7601]ARU13983.1 hypothetical protein P7601_42 [Streptococcus phage P7601]